MNKKKVIIILIIIVPILIFTYYLTSGKTLINVNSPDSSYKIIVKCNEPFLKGPFTIRIYYKKKYSIVKTYLDKTMIFYDGSSLSSDYYNITWEGNTAKLTLKSEGDPIKQIFLINVENSPKIKEAKLNY